MLLLTLIAGAAGLWWSVAVVIFAASLFGALLQPRIRRGRAEGSVPPVSLILPIKLINPGFERAEASAFRQAYADYEVLVASAEEPTPATDILRHLMAAATIPSRLVRSEERGAVSPKLDNLAAAIEVATHDVVVTKDSNITLPPDGLVTMTRALAPDVGLVCAVPVAVRPETFAGRIEAILINRDARLLLTASASGKGYGVGKTMAFRRGDLARAGGIAAISYTIAEDTALSRVMARIGLKTVFADATVEQEIGAVSFAAVYGRQARWAVIRRAEEPVTFVFEPLACPAPAALAAALAAPLLGLAPWVGFAGTLVGWYALEVAVTAAKRWELRPWTPLTFLGRDVVLLGAWLHAWTTREVVWAGEKRNVGEMLRAPKS